MSLPEPALNYGAITIAWWPARITRALDYPTPGESHWLPEGTEGWAFRKGGSWAFTASELTGFWATTNRFFVPEEALETTGEPMQQSYCLPESAYESPHPITSPKHPDFVEALEERTEIEQ